MPAKKPSHLLPFGLMTALSLIGTALLLAATTVVPTDIQQPGTQPNQVGNRESPDKCDNCHGGYNQAVEPAFNWRGSMMANAGRDPLFWATLAVAEQDFEGAGDLCIRCHSTSGWYGGHSTPTDGSGLTAGDADGVDCDACHTMTNTDNSEHLGVMTSPFIANDEMNPATGYYGSGMLSLWGGAEKLGPYADADARHQFQPSKFHRSVDFCGSCHDVSNPAVGDLAHNHGAQVPLLPSTYSGVPGGALEQKAAFNNFPYQYGVVERTYSEFKSGLLSQTLVSSYSSLPSDLQAGAVKAAKESAQGNYSDGMPRYFSCQTCHLRAVTGAGCNKAGVQVRSDLPLHDMTGGNYWTPDAILYQDSQGTLRLGGGLTTMQKDALLAGKSRAQQQLRLAATLSMEGNTLKITNLTGHKLISGYPEGRRMWLNVQWYDDYGSLLREDGRYGTLNVSLNGVPLTVKTILDLEDANTKIYEAHYAITQEWASQLLALGYSSSVPLAFDRLTGAVAYTLGELAAQQAGTHYETFHFVLNNHVAKDNRIPPYGMSYSEAAKRNALPVPATQYGSPSPGGVYNHWDLINLSPPTSATHASIQLLYQPTSWEYIQFLYFANNGQNAFLGGEGSHLLQAWLSTGMAEPYVMAAATWSAPSVVCAVPRRWRPPWTWTALKAPDRCPSDSASLGPLGAPAFFYRGLDAYYSGRLNEATAAFKKALELDPELPATHTALGTLYLVQSYPQRALAEMELEPELGWRLYGLALTYHALGREKESNAALAELVARYGTELAFQIAEVYAFRGEVDLAFEWLERAYAQGDVDFSAMEVDPLLKILERDPRYAAFLKKVRLPPMKNGAASN